MKKDDMTILSDHAEVTFAPKETPAENQQQPAGILSPQSQVGDNEITLIHATGNVIIKQGDKQIHSKEAFYYQKEDKVILLGEPTALEKDYKVTGTKMTIFLHENRSIVEGSKVIIQPKNRTQK